MRVSHSARIPSYEEYQREVGSNDTRVSGRARAQLKRGIGAWDYARNVVRAIQDILTDHARAINSNEGSVIVIDQNGSLPTAGIEYLGRLALTQRTGGGAPAQDQLWICLYWTTGAYAWREIVPI